MTVTCPHCNGLYSVTRTDYPSINDEMQTWDEGQKAGQPTPKINRFYCSDCQRYFTSEGRTIIEVIKDY